MSNEQLYEKGDLVIIKESNHGNKVFRVASYITREVVDDMEISIENGCVVSDSDSNDEEDEMTIPITYEETEYSLTSVIGYIAITAKSNRLMLVCPVAHSSKYILHLDQYGYAPSDMDSFPSMDFILDEIAKIMTISILLDEVADGLSQEKKEQLENWKQIAKDLQEHQHMRNS